MVRSLFKRGAGMLLAAFLLFGFVSGASLANESEEHFIHLQYASFDPLTSEPAILAEQRLIVPQVGPVTSLLQFTGPVLEEWKAAVQGAGVMFYDYVPEFAFIVRGDAAAIQKVSELPFVRWVGPYHPAYRLAPSLQNETPNGGGPVALVVQTLPDANLDALEGRVRELGGEIESREAGELAGYLRVKLATEAAVDLAAFDGVLWIEPSSTYELLNDIGGGAIINAGNVRAALNLYGSGQIVGVADTGLDVGTTGAAMSDDFEGRIVEGKSLCSLSTSTWNDTHGHGTHVAGSVLGNGKLSGSKPGTHIYNGSFAGVAPEAQLVFQSITNPLTGDISCIPGNFTTGIFKPAYDLGARIHTNSWGADVSGVYNTDAKRADEAAWAYKNLLILFAAGNSGVDADQNGKVDHDSISSPGTAKNVVTVGASENDRPAFGVTWSALGFFQDPIASDYLSDDPDGLAAFSSRGPTNDGRIKPDVVAPGTFVLSTRTHDPDGWQSTAVTSWGIYPNNENYMYNGGTSMATPLTAGAAALVREWLVETRGFTNPSSALMKSVLINGAADMSPGQYSSPQEIPAFRPNNDSGWGRVDLRSSLNLPSPQKIWLQDNNVGLGSTQSITYIFTVGVSTAVGGPLRVTLAWTDFPASTTASKALVNNLDLELVGPGGARFYGNAGLYSAGHSCLRDGKWDKCNNVEGVIIPAALPGQYQVVVHGYNIAQGPQPFALVASGDNLANGSSSLHPLFLPFVLKK